MVTEIPASTAEWLLALADATPTSRDYLAHWATQVWDTWATWRTQVARGGHGLAECIPLAIVPEVALHLTIPDLADDAPCIGRVTDSPAEWTLLAQTTPGLALIPAPGAPDINQLQDALEAAHAAQRDTTLSLSLYPAGSPSDGVLARLDAMTMTGAPFAAVTSLLGEPTTTSPATPGHPATSQWRWTS